MNFDELNEKLNKTFILDTDNIFNISLNVNGLSFLKIRDYLISKGKVYLEDTESQIYIAIIYGGIANKNPAYIILNLIENALNIAIYAKEGLIKQNTCEGVINEIKREFKKYIQK